MRLFRRTGGGGPGGGSRVAAARAIGEFVHRAEMDRTEGEAIFHGIVPTGVLGVAAAGHRAVIADERKGIGAAGRIVSEHRIGTESALTAEGQRAESRGRYTAKELIIEGLAGARAVAGERIAAAGQTVVEVLVAAMLASWPDCGLMPVEALNTTDQPGQKLLLAPDAETRLRQVVRRDEESRLIAVAVHQRFAFIVVAVFRQTMADPTDADVVRAVQRDAVPGQGAIGGEEFLHAGAGSRWCGGGRCGAGGARRRIQNECRSERREGVTTTGVHRSFPRKKFEIFGRI